MHHPAPAQFDTVAPSCLDERHVPSRSSIRHDGDVRRARCRGCGCTLVRTLATRAWYRSGALG